MGQRRCATAPAAPSSAGPTVNTATSSTAARKRPWMPFAIGAALLVAAAVAGGVLLRSRNADALTDKDSVVVADFTNTTGDGVFDGTLKQALSVDLEQSPFLRVVPQARVQQTLALMGRQPGERLTIDLTRDLCLRVGSKAMLSGSISSLGSQYVLTLNAINCQTGDSLAQEQAQAETKERVLDVLGAAVSKMRGRLGESIASIKKFDVPLEQVTTSSLEALKALAMGNAEFDQGRELESLPFYRRAVELDRNFAYVYARMGVIYRNAGEMQLAVENTAKAYELRDRVSEREKLTSRSTTTKPSRVRWTRKSKRYCSTAGPFQTIRFRATTCRSITSGSASGRRLRSRRVKPCESIRTPATATSIWPPPIWVRTVSMRATPSRSRRSARLRIQPRFTV